MDEAGRLDAEIAFVLRHSSIQKWNLCFQSDLRLDRWF